jgi:hypothetical protein
LIIKIGLIDVTKQELGNEREIGLIDVTKQELGYERER